MRALLSTIGSRGEAQPVVALAVKLAELGHQAVACAPPDFQQWAESLGVPYVPVGPLLHGTAKTAAQSIPTPAERQQMIDGTVAEQFRVLRTAARGCDVVVGGGALAIAAHSVAEELGVPYVYAAFAPVTLPSPHHAPPAFAWLGDRRDTHPSEIPALWARDAERWNAMWKSPLNAQRSGHRLPPVEDVRSYLFTSRPWLAADPVIAPWPGGPDIDVLQTGAWVLDDPRPPEPGLEAFLEAGDPPLYFGFGSVRAPEGIAGAMMAAARGLGRRAIISQGWAGLGVDPGPDCLVIGEVNHQALLPRVAAVVHHGGAGTTTAAALAGAPQVVVPQMFDQYYFAARVESLGIGTQLTVAPTESALQAAISYAMTAETVSRARNVAGKVAKDGALQAARSLLQLV